MAKNPQVYQLKVTLQHISPPIWRRLLIPSNATFWKLHIAIQDSFGWTDSHLHQFFVGSAWDRDAINICIPNPEDEWYGYSEPYDEAKTKLSKFLSEDKPKLTYVYDFGDDWNHRIVLEKILPFDSKASYPQVITGKRACPWEDSGGPWGYQDKIEILKNEKHKYHDEIAEWVGIESFEELNLELFDPEEVVFRNPVTELKRLKEAWGI